MVQNPFDKLRQEIAHHPSNKAHLKLGYKPLFTGSPKAKIVIVGQAPGINAQLSNMPWNDLSGSKLMQWLGVTEDQFRDESLFALLPMDFYYPGKGKSGDNPPRAEFAPLWHPRAIELIKDPRLFILVGKYAQQYYLGESVYPTLTETVKHYRDFLPKYFPLVHPSPLNFRWFNKNKWFEEENVPELQKLVKKVLSV